MDFIITWVNGNDPKWQEAFSSYKHGEDDESTDKARFRDWDNLQYWFRGIEKFTPWVNKIHFVTWGHLPGWLNTNHPKLNIVNHEDFIPEKYLPTFNSHTIELNFHRIEGLAKEYVYFNDDTFLIGNIKEEDFFKGGKPCDSADLQVLKGIDFHQILFRNISVINRHFRVGKTIKDKPSNWFRLGKGLKHNLVNLCLAYGGRGRFTGFANPHLPQPSLRTTLELLWEKEGQVMDESCQYKFRNYNSVNPYVQRYWDLVSNNFYPVDIKKRGKAFRLQKYDGLQKVLEFIRNQERPMICINDHADLNLNFEQAKEKIKLAFDKILPEKSGFEL